MIYNYFLNIQIQVFCRFLCSSRSATIRAWSTSRVAFRVILCIITMTSLAYIFVPIDYHSQSDHGCPTNQGTSQIFTGIWSLIVFSLGLSVVMFIFGSLTIQRVRTTLHRVAHQNMNNQIHVGQLSIGNLQRPKVIDRQLTQTMILQCSYFGLLSTPVSIYWLYSAVESNGTTDALQNAKKNLVSTVTGYLSITSACTSFYVFTLSSKLFRAELIHLFKIRRPLNHVNVNTTNQIGTMQKD